MFTKIDKIKLDNYFNELARIYKKKVHNYMAEFILVGGASILVNYDFRNTTNDIDAYFLPSSDINEAIKGVSDKYNININWINSDFKNTKSYSNKIAEFSSFYKTYKEIIEVRTIKDEYLVAMKLMSGRIYKNDMSDIVGIINTSRKNGKNFTYDSIDTAVKNLYGSWDDIKDEVKEILNKILSTNDLNKLYNSIMDDEKNARQQLIEFNDKYEDVLNESNINDILKMLRKNAKQ